MFIRAVRPCSCLYAFPKFRKADLHALQPILILVVSPNLGTSRSSDTAPTLLRREATYALIYSDEPGSLIESWQPSEDKQWKPWSYLPAGCLSSSQLRTSRLTCISLHPKSHYARASIQASKNAFRSCALHVHRQVIGNPSKGNDYAMAFEKR